MCVVELVEVSSTLLNIDREPSTLNTASKLKVISLELEHGINYDDCLANLQKRWIIYFSQKYPCIESLGMKIVDDYAADSMLENSLVQAVAHMSHLEGYEMGFCPLTPNILKAMDNGSIKLGNLEFCAVDEDDLTSQLESLKLSQQKQHIINMCISCGDEYLTGDESLLNNTSFDDKFTKLVLFCVNSADSNYTVLVDILENAYT